MPRKQFLEDVRLAGLCPPDYITDVKQYDADGLRFTFSCPTDNTRTEACLTLITTAVDGYPSDNGFLLFTDDSDVNPIIQCNLEQIQLTLDGSPVQDALTQISDVLLRALTHMDPSKPVLLNGRSLPTPTAYQSPATDDDTPDPNFDDEDFGAYEEDPDANFGFDEPQRYRYKATGRPSNPRLDAVNISKLKTDLTITRKAGFRIGIYGTPEEISIICVSVRIARLGISGEAMQSWGLFRHQYLVLLIRFQQGYLDLTQVRQIKTLSGDVEMRVGICDNYKPHSNEAFGCFDASESDESSQPVAQQKIKDSGKLQPLFIGRPLNELLKQQFAQIANLRSYDMSWAGAEQCFYEMHGNLPDIPPVRDYEVKVIPHDNNDRVLPRIVVSDAISELGLSAAPLPLVAMQFLLRHFVRCSEFCLVCHCKIPNAVEAIKPYVCTRPLCLYQFLALGFGPNIEWEIMSQPQVVDLLISLCYAQAHFQKLKDLPLGIGLRVPYLEDAVKLSAPAVYHTHRGQIPTGPKDTSPIVSGPWKGKLDPNSRIIDTEESDWPSNASLHGGDWLALTAPTLGSIHHCRVRSVIDNRIVLSELTGPITTIHAGSISIHEVTCYLYEVNFDELSVRQQCATIISMLDALPPVFVMQTQLKKQRNATREATLNSLSMIPPAARDLLRWVVASNRSCIMQVDKLAAPGVDPQHIQALEPRVGGMNEWMQFRFAQGAPDKELRFIDSIKQHTASQNYSTIFAWHGSPLHNWHSIIRTGLNFDEIVHGRASGHGVYMSPQLRTSMSYTGQNAPISWSNSELRISTVVSLQEVINLTARFVSTSPHLVVAQKDWIQTRYLFVKTNVKHSTSGPPSQEFQQDPKFKLTGSSGEAITIPVNAISKSREPRTISNDAEYDFISDDSENEDLECFAQDLSDDIEDDDCVLLEVRPVSSILGAVSARSKKRKSTELSYILDRYKTDFVPGQLDTSDIKFLPPPNDATPAATRTLMKAFQETVKLQETIPLHELGFYIDPERFDNVYQWIVELHSFESTLPLAQDLKAAGLTSIVLEILFTNDHPYSPPFVRVVKPRFLPFMRGGGGHVTEGGAICMELLTSGGWSVVCTMENVLLQIRLAMSETERPARLQSRLPHQQKDCYGIREALAAYQRACQKHGWKESTSLGMLMARNME